MSSTPQPTFRQRFAGEIGRSEADLDLGRAALLLAGEEYPDLEPEGYLARLDGLAAETAAASSGPDREALAKALNTHLFDHLGFSGNPADYYNPENSFLNRVLDTRRGIPITLSVVYLEVGRRLGLECYGVGMPGHFLVGLADLDLYLDPFHSGGLLSAADCRRLAQEMFGPTLAWDDAFLAPCPKKSILFRMLNNLRQIYLRQRDYRRAVAALQRMTLIDPTAASLYKEEAWCQVQLGDYRPAIRCLETYLERAGTPADAAEVKRQIETLRDALSRLN